MFREDLEGAAFQHLVVLEEDLELLLYQEEEVVEEVVLLLPFLVVEEEEVEEEGRQHLHPCQEGEEVEVVNHKLKDYCTYFVPFNHTAA